MAAERAGPGTGLALLGVAFRPAGTGRWETMEQ